MLQRPHHHDATTLVVLCCKHCVRNTELNSKVIVCDRKSVNTVAWIIRFRLLVLLAHLELQQHCAYTTTFTVIFWRTLMQLCFPLMWHCGGFVACTSYVLHGTFPFGFRNILPICILQHVINLGWQWYGFAIKPWHTVLHHICALSSYVCVCFVLVVTMSP